MNDTCNRGMKLLWFLLGLTLPIAAYAIWCKPDNRREEIDQAHDITVEDSFPASDPPSAW
jgi:hypothetical protein